MMILYELDSSEIPTDLQVMINNNEKGAAILRIVDHLPISEGISFSSIKYKSSYFFAISIPSDFNDSISIISFFRK